ncbi:hypothetical protein B0H19DRAFT_1273885 [Mycena capillaripes]|nr:hypothetical protein B0H19DRAFT_1273885 [Mycena capillaripes]
MAQHSPTMAEMTEEEENTFIDSFIDYTGGMPPTPPKASDSIPPTSQAPKPTPSEALDLLGVQILLMRIDALRTMHGQGSTSLLELMDAKMGTEKGPSSTSQDSLLNKLLALPPAEREPVALVQAACDHLTDQLRTKVFILEIPPISASSSPPKRRKLHTPAIQLTNGGRCLCPTDLDPTIPAPDLVNPVWVSCFSDLSANNQEARFTPDSVSRRSRNSSGGVSLNTSPHSSPPSSPRSEAHSFLSDGSNLSSSSSSPSPSPPLSPSFWPTILSPHLPA